MFAYASNYENNYVAANNYGYENNYAYADEYNYDDPTQYPVYYEPVYYEPVYYEPPKVAPLSMEDFPKVSINTLYIPYIGEQYSAEDIRELFSKYCIAMVRDVDFKTDYNNQRSAYVHIKYWFFSRMSANFIHRLLSDKEARMIVNEPEYWLILPSNAKKRTIQGRKLRIQLDEDMPALVNVWVCDEYTAYEYEVMNARTEMAFEDDIETSATSFMDTLDIGLRHDMSNNIVDDYDYDSFSDESIEEYRNTRMYYRRMNECK